MTTPFEQAIHDIYRVHPGYFFPYVGSRYLDPEPNVLRVLALGINAHVEDAQWPPAGPPPTWFGSWFEQAKYRYQRRVLKDVDTLVRGLAVEGTLFHGRPWHGASAVYATNAVKVYLPDSEGKKASQVGPEHFERHRDQWHQELRVMAEHKALPDLIVVFGVLPWATAWQAFCPTSTGTKSGLSVSSYRNPSGPSHHHANRIVIEGGDGQVHDLLLVRLRHPAGRSPTGSPSWLLRQPDLRVLVGLPGP
jgi:hypothetical protein